MTFRATAANSANIGSIIGEWNAWDVFRRRQSVCLFSSKVCKLAIASLVPETTHIEDELTTAKAISSLNQGVISASDSETANIDPVGICCINLLIKC